MKPSARALGLAEDEVEELRGRLEVAETDNKRLTEDLAAAREDVARLDLIQIHHAEVSFFFKEEGRDLTELWVIDGGVGLLDHGGFAWRRQIVGRGRTLREAIDDLGAAREVEK